MYVGDKNYIDMSSSRFSDFINKGNLYVDKTAFIEHVLENRSKVLLFTRPRRMGKSLNMNTLATFLDCKQDTAHLFKRLYIEKSDEFAKINQYPVVYLDFVNLTYSNMDDLRKSFRRQIRSIIKKFFDISKIEWDLQEYVDNPTDYSPDILGILLKAIAERYDKEPFLIIDEYDRIIMDTLNHRESDEIKGFIVGALQSALKGETHFEKAVLTGVTRTTKENLFSPLNNLEVYDILHESKYDADFSLTETELLELIPADQLDGVRKWYNNMRVGKELLYNVYSVMSYLSKPNAGLVGYWTMTGGGNLLSSLLTKSRLKIIERMLDDGQYHHSTTLDYQMNMEHLKNVADCSDISFYTIAVQAGYLSFERVRSNFFKVFIPNEEARRIWARLYLDVQHKGSISKITDIFDNISDVDQFSERLTDFASMALSYHDMEKKEAESLYHVFFFTLMYVMDLDCKSNREAGLGRADILVQTPEYSAILEFKTSDSPTDEALKAKTEEAIKQIDEKEYWHEVRHSPLPVYKVGVACCGKKCLVKAVLHT